MSDTSTRSGLLWEVERILSECKELGTLPQVLLMENVIQVHGDNAKDDFNRWQLMLEELGYKNYWQDLIATDYGIPQTRNRTFMISILGDYNYTFPKPIPLKLKLKDMLEDATDGDGVDISSRMEYHRGTVQKEKVQTLTTQCDRGVVINNINSKAKHQQDIIQDSNGNARALVCGTNVNGGHYTKTLMDNLRIRKLTPRECFRLMGVKDEDFDRVKKNQSDSSLYHLAGDSTVTQCLQAIFKEML